MLRAMREHRMTRCAVWAVLLVGAAAVGRGSSAQAAGQEPSPASEDAESGPSGEAPDVSVTLIADRSAIVPGGKLRLGVVVDIEPGWHIYWRNPGDSGEATSIQFELPAGFVAPQRFATGELSWPLPQRFEEPGGMVTYGYSGRAVWMAEVRAPESAAQYDALTLAVRVGYLACKDLCLPGEADAALVLPVAERSVPTPDAALLDEVVYPEPVTVEEGRYVLGGRVELRPQMVRDEQTGRGAVKIELHWGQGGQPTDVAFFPDSDPAYTSMPATIRSEDGVTTIHMPMTRLRGVDPVEPWQRHVVAWAEADGERRALVVPMLITRRGPDAAALTDDAGDAPE